MIKVNKVYVFLLAAACIYAFLDGGKFSSSIFYCLLFFLITGGLEIMLHMRHISVNTNFDKEIYETGDSADFNVTVKNNSILPVPIVMVKNSTYSDFSRSFSEYALSLGIFQAKQLKFNVNFTKRGVYNFGNASLNIKDFFSIFNKPKNVNEDKIIKVYPHVYCLKGITSAGNENFETLSSRKGTLEDMSAIDDIRKYRFGDSLKRVHWKISAKHGELYTKNFETVSGEECNLMLDMSKSGYFIDNAEVVEEQLIELFCSVIEYMMNKGVKSTVYLNHGKPAKFDVKSRDDMDAIKEFFLYNYSDGDENFAKFIDTNSHEIQKAGWLGIFVPKVNSRVKEAIQVLKYAGYNITVFYVCDNMENLQYIQELKNFGIEALSFNDAV